MELTGIGDRASGRALARRGSRRADRGRRVLPALLLAVSVMLALAAGGAPAPAEARDLLILRTELRHGELLSCDATACRLDGSTIPRRDVVWIGLGDPPLPSPAVRSPLIDELHLRDGSVRPGPLVSLDARRVVTPARAYERREVRWIYLAPLPAGSADGGGGAGGGGGGEDGTCGFWLGMVGRRGVFRNPLFANTHTETVRTVYTVRLREGPRSTPGTMSIAALSVSGRTVDLQTDDATVRERLRGTLSGPGGNRVAGSGTGHIGAGTGGGRLVLAEPSGPTYYQFDVGTDRYRYPETVRWFSGNIDHRERGPAPIYVGTDPDPEEPRTLGVPGRSMKGEYTRTHDYGSGSTLDETVAWDLTRTVAPCKAPPALPPLPAETEPPEDAEP